MTRSQRFLVSVLIVVSVPVAMHFIAPAPPVPVPPAPPPPLAPPPLAPPPAPATLGEAETRDLSGHWRGTWEDGPRRLVFSFHVAHRRPEGFVHATGTVMRIRDGILVDSILTVALGGRVAGGTLELGAPPPWTRTTTTGAFSGTLADDRRSAQGEVMGLDGTVLPLDLQLITPAVDRAEGAYSLPESFPRAD